MSKANEVYLGISGVCSHDAAASLVRDGKVIAAAEEERFIREKHTGKFPYQAILFCLKEAKVNPEDVACVSYYFNPSLRYSRALQFNLQTVPDRIRYKLGREGVKATWASIQGALGVESLILKGHRQAKRFTKKFFRNACFKAVEHHYAHAASAFYTSPFTEASVLTVDLIGEWATTGYFDACNSKLQKIKEIAFPHSLGKMYQMFTKFLGFSPYCDEYKVMGLAAYGTDTYVPFFTSLYQLYADGSFSLDQDTLLFCRGIYPEWDEKITSRLGLPRKVHEPLSQNHADIAYALQKATENILIHLVRNIGKATGRRNLCLAGGVALNSLANQRIRESGLVDDLYIPPAPHDGGASLGAALYSYFRDNPSAAHYPLEDSYLGPSSSLESIRAAVRTREGVVQEGPQAIEKVVDLLVAGKIVAVFQGRMEFGPRALGNRSILADPRNKTMKDLINFKVKFREPFRPFAPVVLEEDVETYFIQGKSSPFMTQTFTATELCKEKAPAIVHQDGTSRVQTVTPSSNSGLYALVKRFKEKTGVPLLLNTSFNVAGEPIVCSPDDALHTFIHSGIDALLMEEVLLTK